MKRIILAAAALACNTAFAADSGAYVSASVGSAEQKVSVEGYRWSQHDTGAQLAGGYRFTPNVGIEAGYTTFGTASVGTAGATVSSKPRSIHVAATGVYHFTREFAVSGKLGVASNRTELEARFARATKSSRESETSVVFGVGASYAFTPNVALIAEYQNFGKVYKEEGASLKASMLSAGVRFSF